MIDIKVWLIYANHIFNIKYDVDENISYMKYVVHISIAKYFNNTCILNAKIFRRISNVTSFSSWHHFELDIILLLTSLQAWHHFIFNIIFKFDIILFFDIISMLTSFQLDINLASFCSRYHFNLNLISAWHHFFIISSL